MTMMLKGLAHRLVSKTPIARRLLRPRYGFFGDYGSWQEAVRASTGYDSAVILEKAKVALLKVKNGEAVYERDSVLFDEIHYSWSLLAGLMWIAAVGHGRLNVVDFGGSLGSTYFQNREFLKSLAEVHWNIVEQPHFVAVGKEHFETGELRFYHEIDTCLKQTCANAVIFSSVLQYLEDPYETLRDVFSRPVDYVLIDRTPFHARNTDRLCVQRVSPSIFDGSYPIWIFSTRKFGDLLKSQQVVAEFPSFENGMYGYDFKGFIVKVIRE
jgi:putative methyltransferase (TIGR04325 family)